MRTLHRLIVPFFIIISALFSQIETWAQASPITAAPPAAGYPRHETDAQTQIQLTLNSSIATFASAGCGVAGACNGWTVTVGGSAVQITSVSGSGTTVIINFTPAVGIGQAVTVAYTGGNGINAFGPATSYNDRALACSDFTFQAYLENTPPCAPVKPINKMVFAVNRAARNSARWATTTKQIRVFWINNGASPLSDLSAYESTAAGVAQPNSYFITGDAAADPYQYPGNENVCGYTSNWRIKLTVGATITACPVSQAPQTQVYASWNTDAVGEGSGQLLMPPSVVGSDRVCVGSNVNMRFTDNTALNCNPTTAPIPTNDEIRWVRVVYGSTDLGGGNTATSNIPNIQVGGTPVTDANGNLLFPGGYFPVAPATTTFGNPDAFGVVQVNKPVNNPRGLLEQITTSIATGQVVGQRFYVRLEYWNICNAYNTGDLSNRRSIESYVEIISKPAALTTTGSAICYQNPNNITGINFTATGGVAGRTAVNWYRNLAAVASGTRMTNPNGNNSLTFPASAYGPQGGVGGNFTTNNVNGRYYSVWATQVVGATNSCESDPVEIVIIQQPRISSGTDLPDVPSGATEVCNGPPATTEEYTTNEPPVKTIPASTSTNGVAINLPTENIWSVNAFAAGVTLSPLTGNSTTVTFNMATQPNPTDPGEVRVRRGYVTSTNINIVSPLPAPFTLPTYTINPLACLNNNRVLDVTVFGQSNGGTISGTKSICDGASTGNMTVTGHRGAILQWERSFNGGAFIAIAGTGGLATFSEVPPNGPGPYRYRVVVQNQNAAGPCAPATTVNANQSVITVNPVPGKPTITETGASDGLAICLGEQTVLQSNNPGGIGGVTYRWYKTDNMVTPVQSGASNTLTLTTIAQSGDYVVQIVGPATTNCPSALSDPVTVTISGLPTASVSGGGAACDGNPAPDIIWTFSGGSSYNFTIDRPGALPDIVVTNHNDATYTLSGQDVAGNYVITALSNAVTGCAATALPGPAVVTTAGGSPQLDGAPSINPEQACINGTSATDPVLTLKLTAAFANLNGFILNYTINGGANSTKTFNTDAAGNPTTTISFTEAALNVVATHTIRLVSIQSPAGCLQPLGINLTYIVRPLPAINTQPVAAQVCVGGDATFTVDASTGGGGSTAYQWEVQTGGAGPWTALTNGMSGGVTTAGATTNTLTLSGVTQAMNTNRYRVIVTGVFAPSMFSCPVTSSDVALTVRPYATITAQPPTRVLCAGENTTFGVTANVAGPSTITGYQWQISTAGAGGPYSNLSNVAPYSGVTTATMTITGATTALSGNHYRVLVTTTGACALPSDPGPLTVNPNPVSNAISPIVCEDIIHVPGNPSVGTGQATNVDLNQFSAQLADLPGGAVEVPPGFEVLYYQDLAHSVQITTPTTISNNEQIFTRVRNIATNCFTDRTITFTVRPQPVPTRIVDQVCEDSPPGSNVASGIDLTAYETTITGGAANRTVEWYTDPSLALASFIQPGTLPNQDQNYSISATTTLFAKVIDTTPGTPGCHSIAELELEYQPRPVANTIRDGAGVAPGATYTVCASNNLVFLQIDPTVNPGATYTWNVPTPPALPSDPGYFELLTGTNGFFIILRFPSLIPSPGIPISVTESLGTSGCEGTPINLSVIVEGSPPAPVITGPGTVCSNSSVVYSVPFVAGDTYSWTVPPGATITSFPITNSITVQMSTLSGNVTVTVANSTGCVAPPSVPVPVTVVQRPAMTSVAAAELCSGQAPDDVHTLTASIGGTTYRWEVISISGFVTGASVGDTDGSLPGSNTPGAATIDTRTLRNTSGVTAAVIYRVTPVSPPTAGVYCEGNPQNVTITIRPEPELVLTPKTVCSDEPANYEIKLATVGLPVGTQFTWAAPVMSDGSTQGTAGTNVPAGAAGTIHINDAFVNTTAAPITATYTIVATSGAGCSSNQAVADRQVVITINPKPLVSTTLNKDVCSDEALALTLTTAPGSTAAGSYDIISRTVDPLLTPHAGNATVPQSNVTGAYLANDKFTNTSGGPLQVTYLVSARGTAGLGACQGPTQLITITINSGPATNPVTDEVCSDTAGGNTYVEDLTSLQPQVNPDGTLIFEWYTDAAATLPIATPTAYPLQNGVPVYVKVHNGAGTCAKIQAVEYVVNPTPAVTASITSNYNGVSVRCITSSDGTITADVATLGSPNYTYSIDGSNFFTGRIFNGLSAAGNPYVVTVRDARGCTATSAPLSLVVPPALTATPVITSDFNGQHVSCQGANDGEVTVNAAGGVGLVNTDYTYSILELPGNTTGANTGVFTGLTAGTYTFVVRDANNCAVTSVPVTLIDPPAITATAVLTSPVTCNGAADGVITVTAGGGTLVGPAYTYTIFPGGTSNTTGVFTGLPAGTYTVNVTDDNSCSKTSNTVTVTQPATLTAFASVTSNYHGAKISCPGADDAVITVTANGGNGGYAYELIEDPANTTGDATGIYTGIGPGTYTVRVTDAQACAVITVPVNVTEPTPLNATGLISAAISCHGGSDGEIRISSTGGTGAYTFTMISPAGPTNATGIFSGLAQGTYDFEVRDLNNCVDVVQIILDEPTAVTASAAVQTPYNGAQISCNGASDGVITVTASGGTGALTYVFDQFPANLTGRTTGVFTGVPPGTGYTFTVRDAKNCTAPVTVPVDVIQPLPVAAFAAVTSDYNGEDISCPTATDGIITVTASGGTGALTYRLDQAPLNMTGAASGVFTGVGAGSYTITVRDANSCFVVTVPVTVAPPTAVTASAAVTSSYNGRQISCNGASDGILTVTATGGVAPYAYVLNEIPGNVTGAATGIFTGLPAGTYTVNVTDANGCPVVTLPVTISEPTPVTGTSNVTSNYNGQQLRCVGASDGIIRVTGSGGTAPYTFISIEVPGNVTGATTGIFTGLPAGSYTFTVRDANNCTFVTPAVVISPPTPLTASALVTSNYHGSQISCNGAADGTITITATGGTGALTYVFVENPANTTGATSGMFTGIAAGGPYTFLVTDANTCNVTTVGINIAEPDPVVASAAVTSDYNGEHISCPAATDGVITVTVSGGTGVYTYRLDQAPLNTTGNATGIYSNVGAGTYTVTVRDENSCFVVTVPVTVVPPTPVTATAAVTSNHNGRQISCNGASDGELTVTAGGGVGGYTYVLNQIPANVTGAATGIFTGLPAGTYTITVRDANNCPVTTLPVVISEPAVLGATAAVTSNYNGQQISCNGASDGIITISVSGGTGPYTYTSVEVPGNVTGAANGIFTGLPAGNYTFNVMDVNTCATTTAQVTISQPNLMAAALAVTSNYNGRHVSCNGASDGILTVTVTVPGTGGLIYTIDQIPANASGRFSGVFTGIPPGNYTVTVRDANNCSIVTNAVTVDPTDPIVANAVVTKNVNCFAEANGIVTVTASGGTGSLEYLLIQDASNLTGQFSGVFSGLRAGPYTVRVTDINTCFVTTALVTVTQPDNLTVTIAKQSPYNGFDLSCSGASDGEIHVTATAGGTGPYTYTLDGFPGNTTGETTGIFTGLSAGLYTITVTDSNPFSACTRQSLPVFINNPIDLSVNLVGLSTAICIGDDPGVINQISPPVGGIGVYTYQWQESVGGPFTDIGGAVNPTFDPPAITQTTQYRRILSSGSCVPLISDPVTITVNPLPEIANVTAPQFLCENQAMIVFYDFAPGQAPFYFSYIQETIDQSGAVIATKVVSNEISGDSKPVIQSPFTDDVRITVTGLHDFNGCVANPALFAPHQRYIEVLKTSADFTATTATQCDGSPFEVQWDANPEVEYTFVWPEGPNAIFGPGLNGPQTDSRILHSQNPTATQVLPIIMTATNTLHLTNPAAPACGVVTHMENISLFPTIIPNIVVPIDSVCSGTPLSITNSTQGGVIHAWTVTDAGGTVLPAPLTRTGPLHSSETFVIHNQTLDNPAQYEIAYHIQNSPANGNCSRDTTVTVTVFREAIAKIGAPKDPLTPIPLWTAPSDDITFNNATVPYDTDDFTYTWIISNNNPSTPADTLDGNDPTFRNPTYTFLNPGAGKRAILIVVNDLALQKGMPNGCATRDEFIFTINVPPLTAQFDATPLADCLPTMVEVTNNSTGEFVSEWRVVNQTNNEIYHSQEFEPQFPITSPGRYTISLVVKNPYDATAEETATPVVVDVYANPVAAFITIPLEKVFVPDQEMRTDNGSASAFDPIASVRFPIEYRWYFGDGSDTVRTDININPNPVHGDLGHSPTHRYETEGSYQIALVALNRHDNKMGGHFFCRDTAYQMIEARASGVTKVPNAFTPNPGGPNGGIVTEDGTTINDVFLPITKGVVDFQMQIFDRWGNLVFESKNRNQGWDGYDRNGNLVPAGVYVYKLVLRMANDQRTTQVGDVTLIR